jgi:hypothetical protein
MRESFEVPISDQEAEILDIAWRAQRDAAHMVPGQPDVGAAFQQDLAKSAMRMGLYEAAPGQYSLGVQPSGCRVLRWHPAATLQKAQ